MGAQWSRRSFLQAGVVGASALALGPACSWGANAASNLSFSVENITYGPEPMQSGELIMTLAAHPRPVVVLLHGGYWQNSFNRAEMTDLAKDLARIGYASWNLDYRRVGDPGGGWPNTAIDVAAGIDKLAELAPTHNIDTNRVIVLGHSAGAQLGSWAAARKHAAGGAPGANPAIVPKAVVNLAGVLDLVTAANDTGGGQTAVLRQSVLDFLGGSPAGIPQTYQQASPIGLLPLGMPQLLLHGVTDDRVPLEQSRTYVAAATKAGDPSRLIEIPGINHFDVVKTKAWWDDVTTWMTAVTGNPGSPS